MSEDSFINEARTIERWRVDSTSIESVGYDDQRRILAVEFKGGSIFHYYNVPASVFEDMGSAPSRGKFYTESVRGKFVGKAMTGMCPACKTKGLIGEECSCGEGTYRAIDRTHKEG